MKALATIGVGSMRPVLDVALRSFRPYAEAHGYDVVIGNGASQGRPTSWAKIPLIRRLLEAYDEVLWLDADIVIVDPSLDISDVVPADDFQAFACEGAPGQERPNAGVWLVRRDERTEKFLDLVWSAEEHVHGQGLWENLAVLDLLGYSTEPPFTLERTTPWRAETCFLPGEWNSLVSGLDTPEDARFVHFAAMPNEKRVRLMRLSALRAGHQGVGTAASWRARTELVLRRAELSLYVRRRGVSDRRTYSADRF